MKIIKNHVRHLLISGLIVAKLLAKTKPPQINDVWDLVDYPEIKLILNDKTFYADYVLKHPAYDLIKSQVEIRKIGFQHKGSVEKAINDVFSGKS